MTNRGMNLVSIVGARPNFIKLAPVYKNISNEFNHTIIHTGQHYDFELSEIFFKDFDLPKPDINLDVGSGSQVYQIGNMILRIEEVLRKNNYNLVIVYGDTNTTLAGALAANKSNLKVAHIESGLRSFDRRMPEEINRILTDNVSELLFSPTWTAVQNLKNENIYGKIINSGDLSVEIIKNSLNLVSKSGILNNLSLESKSYVLITMHRAENTQSKDNLLSIIKSFEKLKEIKFVFPMHPRTRKTLRENNLFQRIQNCKNVMVINPIGYIDFICLMKNADKIITDSGGVQKEAFILSVPCITIRKNTEWIETVNEGWNILVDTDSSKIVKAVKNWHPIENINKSIFGNGKTSKIINKEIIKSLTYKK